MQLRHNDATSSARAIHFPTGRLLMWRWTYVVELSATQGSTMIHCDNDTLWLKRRKKKSLERQGLHMAELDLGSELEGNIQVIGG